MPPQGTRAILKVLQRGKEDKVARAVLKVFGASSLEECSATYELVGNRAGDLGRGGGAGCRFRRRRVLAQCRLRTVVVRA